MRPSPVSPTIDLGALGVSHGHLRLPLSLDASAWGNLMTPITVIANGDGPTVLMTGGNHGDEYEGPITLSRLASEIDPAEVAGRIILLPFLNYAAVRAGKRTSPIDGGNMNRVYPGKPDGGATEKVADYVTRHLLPLADLVLDFHSCGKTLDFVPFCASHVLENTDQQAACAVARDAFRAPWALSMVEIDAVGMIDAAVEEMGKIFITTEIAGGGTATPQTVALARRGAINVLRHVDILPGEIEGPPSATASMPGDNCYVFSDGDGLFEPCIDLGSLVQAGDLLARVHSIQHTGRPPREYRAGQDGILFGRHFPGLIAQGDFVAMIAVPD
jgi:N-alpha-acetyl-L-2,4-diaminobutyrate deacetylase